MPVSPVDVSTYCGLLIRSRLMSVEDVNAAQQRWLQAGKSDTDVEGFYKSLVANKQLSEYQAALVNRGHSEGFFLDSYKIVDLIARGRLAGVYKAVHVTGQQVAIKVLPSSKVKEPQALARFLREAKLLLRLEHPNVVRAFHTGEAGGRYYIAMEYLEGDTLEELLQRRKRFAPQEACRLIYQALLGLQYLHEKSLIHRDMKPANLMLVWNAERKEVDSTQSATVKILDIGLGRELFDENVNPVDVATQLTTDGMILGTPDYMAPEQARRAHEVDIRADIYSLGCVLYHCLTGQPPFPDTNFMNQVIRHGSEPPRPLSEFLQPVPDGLQSILNWMMAKEPEKRYSTPQRAAEAIHLFLSQTVTMTPLPKGRSETRLERPKTLTKPEPVAQAQPVSSMAQAQPVSSAEYDVELLRVGSSSNFGLEQKRSLLDWDRRDVLMMTFGAAGISIALATGYTLARLLRPKPTESPKEPPAE